VTVMGSPQVNLFIDPQGAIRVLSTHERVFCPAFRAVGSSFPQSSLPPTSLREVAVAVGEQLPYLTFTRGTPYSLRQHNSIVLQS
jgi:hypothetical protein